MIFLVLGCVYACTFLSFLDILSQVRNGQNFINKKERVVRIIYSDSELIINICKQLSILTNFDVYCSYYFKFD
jgi:hypothetical protein